MLFPVVYMTAIYSSMFLLGMFATLAQVVFMREMLAVFYGNELCIGLILCGWFAGISSGALSARRFLGRIADNSDVLRRMRSVCLCAGTLFVIQVCCVRLVRRIIGLPEGEYASPLAVAFSALLICLPSSSAVGYFFPLACRAAAVAGGVAVRYAGTVFFWESAGSALAGFLASLVMVVYMSQFQMAVVTSAAALMAWQFLSEGCRRRSIILSLVMLALFFICLDTRISRSIDFGFEKLRFAGVLGDASGSRLVSTANTPYQSLAVIEYAGQKTLYSNGQVLFVFPDRNAAEHRIHFLLAQNPDARKVLLLGGNPLEDIAELLKYKYTDVTYVEHDPAIAAMIQCCLPAACGKVMGDPRVSIVNDDPYVYAAKTAERYDVVIISLAAPSTVSASRYYSVEFYKTLRNIITTSGYVCTMVSSSERLQADAADMSGSVYKALKSVFPVVLVTAGENNRFFASGSQTVLDFDPGVLAARSSSAGMTNDYFRPEYFLATDSMDPAKMAEAEKKLAASSSSANSLTKPSASFYSMNLWVQYSGSMLGPFMRKIEAVDASLFNKALVISGLCVLVSAAVFRKRLSPAYRSGYMAVLFLTGFSAISAEILLVFVFQSFHGSIYSKIGLIVAAFMLGLVGGSAAGRYSAERTRSWGLALLVISECILISVCISVSVIIAGWPAQGFLQSEGGIYVLTFAAGIAGGVQFPLVCMLMGGKGGGEGKSSADAVWSDNAGAAVGALTAGVVFVPVLGIGQTSFLLVMLSVLSLLLIAAAELAGPVKE